VQASAALLIDSVDSKFAKALRSRLKKQLTEAREDKTRASPDEDDLSDAEGS